MSKIVVVAPHPDDEILGAGGYLLKHKEMGDDIFWLIITDMKESYGYSFERCKTRKTEIEKVATALGVNKVYNLELQPAGLEKYPTGTLIKAISEVFQEIKPDIVILPNEADVHSDHGIVFKAAYACTKTFRYPTIKKVMCMEVISETDYAVYNKGFIPNYFVNIEEYIEQKVKIAEIYESEIQLSPFPRSKESLYALSVIRGASCFCKNAEAFCVLKSIEN